MNIGAFFVDMVVYSPPCPTLHRQCAAIALPPATVSAAASIPVVGFNAVYMSEHFGAFLTCAVLHAVFFVSERGECRNRAAGGGGQGGREPRVFHGGV